MKSRMRRLTPDDAASSLELSRLAGWNQVEDDWRRLLTLAPDGCFGIEVEGRIAATCTLVSYGQKLGFIGMVLTHPDHRRKGFARQLVGGAIEQARQAGLRTIKLDATADGRPLYQSYGFREEQPVERWVREGSQGSTSNSGGAVGIPLDLDGKACGYNRTALLSSLSSNEGGVAGVEGYVMSRPGALNRYLGPCVARGQQTAEALIEEALEQESGAGWFWDLLPLNKAAVQIAQSLGFKCNRSLTRMVLGADLRGREEWIYAIAGFELG